MLACFATLDHGDLYYVSPFPPNADPSTYIITLPTNNPNIGPVSFVDTAIYHWPQFDVNVSSRTGVTQYSTGGYTVADGPILFGKADQTNKNLKQCLVDPKFQNPGDLCIMNPEYCVNGFSFSLFYMPQFTETADQLFNASAKFDREYLVSTGGDTCTPGFAIYRHGANMGAVVSTGNLTWEVEVVGALPTNNTWSNLAIRWEQPKFNTQEEYQALVQQGVQTTDMGGLQFLINLEAVGHVILASDVCNCSKNPCVGGNPEGNTFDQPHMMIGCHATMQNSTQRYFATGIFDEEAFWSKYVNDTYSAYFLGGYQSAFNNMTAEALLQLLTYIDPAEDEQAQMGITLLAGIVSGSVSSATTPYQNVSPTTATTPSTSGGSSNSSSGTATTTASTTSSGSASTTASPSQYQDVLNLIAIADKLLNVNELKAILSTSSFKTRIDAAPPVGEMMSTKGAYGNEWRLLNTNINEPGAHPVQQLLDQYLMYITLHRYPIDNNLDSGEIDHIVSTPNFGFEAIRLQVNDYVGFESGSKPGYWTWPDWTRPEWNTYITNVSQGTPVESVLISKNLFSAACQNYDVSIVATIYDTFPDRGTKNPAAIFANTVKLDSRVMSVNIASNQMTQTKTSSGIPTLAFTPTCQPDPDMLVRSPLAMRFQVLSQRYNYGRTLSGYFDDLSTSRVSERYCVVWNPDIGPNGAWDTNGVKTISTSDSVATCYATQTGTFAVVAVIEDEPEAPQDETWLLITKNVGYALSIFFLLIFIFVIFFSKYLWEMFHVLGMNVAIAMLLGDIFMIVAEFDSVQDNRKSCCFVGLCIMYFYTANAALLALQAYAIFRAIVNGVIGGRTKVYLCYGWGVPFITVGADIYLYLDQMGNDPRCMVGWEAPVKWIFFGPVLVFAAFCIVLMAIIVCNIHTPSMRKESLVEELSSIAKGLFVMVVLFDLTWSWSPLAYIDFPGQELPDFYPAFQVALSFLGVFMFVFLGLGSKRFRSVLTGHVMNKKRQLAAASFKDDDSVYKKPPNERN